MLNEDPGLSRKEKKKLSPHRTHVTIWQSAGLFSPLAFSPWLLKTSGRDTRRELASPPSVRSPSCCYHMAGGGLGWSRQGLGGGQKAVEKFREVPGVGCAAGSLAGGFRGGRGAWRGPAERPESGGGSAPSTLHPSGWGSCASSLRGAPAMGFSAHQLLPPPWPFLCWSFFSLGLADGCPAPCRCLGELVDCSRLKLNRVPESLPAWIEQL